MLLLIRCHDAYIHEIDYCTAFGPCSTRHMTPTSLLVCVEMCAMIHLGFSQHADALSMLFDAISILEPHVKHQKKKPKCFDNVLLVANPMFQQDCIGRRSPSCSMPNH